MESGPCEKTDHTQVGMGLPAPVKEGDTDTRETSARVWGVREAGEHGRQENSGSAYDQDLNQGPQGSVPGPVMTLNHYEQGLLTATRNSDSTLGTWEASWGQLRTPRQRRNVERKNNRQKKNENPLIWNECANNLILLNLIKFKNREEI